MNDYRVIGKRNCLLGEGPYWDAFAGKLRMVDIDAKEFLTVDIDDGSYSAVRFPQKVTCIAQKKDGAFIFAMEDGIYTEDMTPIAKRNDNGLRFNDGKVGPDGLFYAGTMNMREGGAALYRLNGGKLESVVENVRISNGIDFTEDGRVFYCDTMEHRIDVFDFPTFEKRRTVYEFEEDVRPDGMCLDEEGKIWSALWGKHCVVRIDPERKMITERVELPATYTSCPAFVGEKLDRMVVTSAKDKLEINDESTEGCTFLIDVGVKGRRPFLLK